MYNFIVFTDGSCHTQLKCGTWVSIIEQENTRVQISGICQDTTHNRMELMAIIESIDYIDIHYQGIGQIDIYTDSQYVVGIIDRKERLQGNLFKSRKGKTIQNDDLLQKLIDQLGKFNIKLVKVQAHQKSGDNENLNREVDKIARKILRQEIKKNNKMLIL
jgi:ribonuclease HI